MAITGIEGVAAGVSGIANPLSPQGLKSVQTPDKSVGFTEVLGDMVSRVNNLQVKADQAIQGFVTGETKGLHEVMIAMEKSSISFQFLSQVRNKAVEAYHDIMRMQV